MSSAILYLAIVGIWAVVLVPRWLRPSHGASRTMESNLAEPEEPGQRGGIVWLEEDEADPDRYDGLAGPGGPETDHTDHEQARPMPRASAAAAERRSRIVAARRRTLLTLLVLTAGAAGMAVAHVAAWWVIVPPAVMLAGFVGLLREAARIDTERARRDARPQDRPAAESDAGTGAGVRHAAPVDRPPAAEPTAKIIDISARIGDQLYDQYADAEVRAVGDWPGAAPPGGVWPGAAWPGAAWPGAAWPGAACGPAPRDQRRVSAARAGRGVCYADSRSLGL